MVRGARDDLHRKIAGGHFAHHLRGIGRLAAEHLLQVADDDDGDGDGEHQHADEDAERHFDPRRVLADAQPLGGAGFAQVLVVLPMRLDGVHRRLHDGLILHQQVAGFDPFGMARQIQRAIHHGVVCLEGGAIGGQHAAVLVVGNERLIVLQGRRGGRARVGDLLGERRHFRRVRLCQGLPEPGALHRERMIKRMRVGHRTAPTRRAVRTGENGGP